MSEFDNRAQLVRDGAAYLRAVWKEVPDDWGCWTGRAAGGGEYIAFHPDCDGLALAPDGKTPDGWEQVSAVNRYIGAVRPETGIAIIRLLEAIAAEMPHIDLDSSILRLAAEVARAMMHQETREEAS